MSLTMTDRRLVLPLALAAALALLAGPARAETAASYKAPAAKTGQSVQAGAPGVSTPAAKGTVNINSATSAEFTRLPRVGSKLADRIVAHRGQHGPFKRVEDLMEVKGVGEKMFVSLKPYLSVAGQTTLASKVGGGSRTSRTVPAGGRSTRSPKGGAGAAPASR